MKRVLSRYGLPPAIVATASTHFVVDAYTNIYAPLLPLLIPRLGLSLTMVGTLAMCFQMASSVSQLAFGAIADRWRPRLLLIGGPLVAVVVLSGIGWASSPLLLALVLVVGGLGGAAFHPPAAALVYELTDISRKGFAMSVHITGGSLGMAVAPLLFTPVIASLGLGYSWVIAIPGLVALWYTLRLMRSTPHLPPRGPQSWAALRPYARPLGLLYLAVVLRTLTGQSYATFLPVLLTDQGMSVSQAGAAVSAYLFVSSIGGFAGGPLADRYGPRRVLLFSLVTSVPFFVAAPFAGGWLLTALVSVGGLLLQSTLPVNVTYGQQIAPVGAATVSSLMMGFAWGVGSVLAPVVGATADAAGLQNALWSVAAVPLLAAACVWALPETQPAARPRPPAGEA